MSKNDRYYSDENRRLRAESVPVDETLDKQTIAVAEAVRIESDLPALSSRLFNEAENLKAQQGIALESGDGNLLLELQAKEKLTRAKIEEIPESLTKIRNRLMDVRLKRDATATLALRLRSEVTATDKTCRELHERIDQWLADGVELLAARESMIDTPENPEIGFAMERALAKYYPLSAALPQKIGKVLFAGEMVIPDDNSQIRFAPRKRQFFGDFV